MSQVARKSGGSLSTSVALATFNGERFLSEQLRSIAKQIVLPDELIVSDDASTDGTLEILQSFASSAPFKVVILLNSERIGYRQNFLKAALACTCEIVLFCDQDDIWDTRKILLMREPFLSPETVMAYHHARLIDENGNWIGLFTEPVAQNPWQPPNGMQMVFRRSLMIRPDLVALSIDFYRPEEKLAHDHWISLLGLAFGHVAVVDELLIEYRQHPGNVYGANQPKVRLVEQIKTRIKDRSDAFEILAEVCRANIIIFRELSCDESLCKIWRERARLAENGFQELAVLYEFRKKIYKSRSIIERGLSCYKLARLEAYSGTTYWTFGTVGFIRDILLGVLLSPLITKLGSQKVFGDSNCRRIP